MTLVGESGVGKTTLLHAIALEYQASMSVARVQQPGLTPDELLAALAEQLGVPGAEGTSPDRRAQLRRLIAQEHTQGRSVLILVDEAHRFAAATLNELLQLCSRQPAPMVILAGEPELLVHLAALEAQGSPVSLSGSFRLSRFGGSGTEGYLTHRLSVAGSSGRILFDPEALAEIQRYTGGTPGLINVLCDSAMGFAEAHSNQRVVANDIRDAVHELKWVEFTARAPANGSEAGVGTGGATVPPRKALNIVPELEVQQSGRPVVRLLLRPGRLVVGRAEDAGLRLDSQFVSRQHCQIITTIDLSFVEDLGSTNGILINGKRRRLHRLVPADRIVIGDHTLTYLETPLAPS
jgi:general secretion pathway protein A